MCSMISNLAKRHRAAARGQNRTRAVVVPVVQDVLEDVRIAVARNLVEELPGAKTCAALWDQSPGAQGDDLRKVCRMPRACGVR